jgi:hypothetical protein
MQPFTVEFTDTAARGYLRLHTQAQKHLEAGQVEHPAVITFNAVRDAINGTLAVNPCDPSRAFAGAMSKTFYKLGLGNITISYMASDARRAVLIMTIGEAVKNPGFRTWLTCAIANGECDELLEKLGIEKPLLKVLDSGLLH